MLGFLEEWEEKEMLQQKAEGRYRILTLQTAPPAHLGMPLPGGEQGKHVL